MSNRFPEDAESLARSTIEQVAFFFLSFLSLFLNFHSFCSFFISPSGKAHREICDFHAVSRILYLICFPQAGQVQFGGWIWMEFWLVESKRSWFLCSRGLFWVVLLRWASL